ncbi:MAG: hypothetical protein WC796_01655 [Candidatus Pacearchaeota archaeon]|jgi:hypothetical protein
MVKNVNNFRGKQLAILIGVVVVVGLIAGFIGSGVGNLTANVIKDSQAGAGKANAGAVLLEDTSTKTAWQITHRGSAAGNEAGDLAVYYKDAQGNWSNKMTLDKNGEMTVNGGIVATYHRGAKLILQDGSYVVKDSSNVYGAVTSITSFGGKVSKFTINVTPYAMDNRVPYVKLGSSLIDPVFESFNWNFISVNPDLLDSSRELIEIKSSGEQRGHLKFTNRVGSVYDLDLFKPSSIVVGSGLNSTMLGFDTYRVVSNASGITRERDLVITRSGQYSQIWEVVRIDVTNRRVTLKDKGTNGMEAAVTLSGSNIGAIGDLVLSDGSSAIITLANNVSIANVAPNIVVSKADSVIYTYNGAKIDLTYLSDPVRYQRIGPGIIQITEETPYNLGDYRNNAGKILGTAAINVTMRYNSATRSGNDLEISSVSVPGASAIRVGDYDDYYLDAYGSYIKNIGNYDKVFDMLYSGSATNYGFYLNSLVGGDSKAVETSGQKLYLGDYMSTTKEAMTKSDMPTLLADGKIVGNDGVRYDYNQVIKVPNSYITYSKTMDNLVTPVLNAYFETTGKGYSMSIVFPTAVDPKKLVNQEITLFGKKYRFSANADDLSTNKLVLYEYQLK